MQLENNHQKSNNSLLNANRLLWLNGNDSNHSFIAIGAKKEIILESGDIFEKLQDFISNNEGWKFGYLSYDLKNNIELLTSNNIDGLQFPKVHFFIPETLLEVNNGNTSLIYGDKEAISSFEELCKDSNHSERKETQLRSRISKKEYLEAINKTQNYIQKGDTYELNFCHEFYNENCQIDPYLVYQNLNRLTKSPFSLFGKFDDKYIVSASPERFIKKVGSKIISQPIKGTAPRGKTTEEDEQLKQELYASEKERSENIMIVDLVRNDFSRFAKANSVEVEELCKVYSFDTVHQMISTVVCEANEQTNFTDIIKAMFPMGSMTGAPKIRSMELIEELESTKRGVYSGAVGYIKPNGDFDFNVIIRTLLYNETNKYVSCMVGGAITSKSDPEKEYEETLLKANAILNALK